jgi:hypothetical protein
MKPIEKCAFKYVSDGLIDNIFPVGEDIYNIFPL